MKCYKKDYPRPQFVRNKWENLNGVWEFGFDDNNVGEKEKWFENFKGDLKIQVPFTYETQLSGIQDETRHDNIWYHKTIQVDGSKLEKNQYILHFEGSDFVTKLWVNGQFAGSHKGGYARFSFDLTNLVHDGENHIVVKVEDSFDIQQPRGKQRWMDDSYSCFYVQTTGIWKTVWSEYVPKLSISSVKMTPNMETKMLEVEYNVKAPESCFNGNLAVEATITFKDRLISKTVTAITAGHVSAHLNVAGKQERGFVSQVFCWSPGVPNLYDIEFRLIENQMVWDEVGSYFAMREICIMNSQVLLNGRPLYQRLILDQGYWRDSHLTPPSEEALIEDIDKIHALGYNGLRKHQKIEDERFLYWCDVKGMLVWSEAAATHEFTDYAVTEFISEWMEIVQQNYNHPCIITWTPVNESWGVSEILTNEKQQHFTEALYYLTKSYDKMRPVIVNDGWVHTVSDIITLHDYVAAGTEFAARYADKEKVVSSEIAFNNTHFAMAEGYEYAGQPIIISEFGGIAFNNDDSGWGYNGKVDTEEEFIKRFDGIVTAVKELPYACGYCYTQVTDIQQEVNGLMDIDRNFKIKPEIIKEINERRVNCFVK